MEILDSIMVPWMAVVTSLEHLAPRLIWPLGSPVVTSAVNLIHCSAQVCFCTDTIFKTSSLRDVPRKKSMIDPF